MRKKWILLQEKKIDANFEFGKILEIFLENRKVGKKEREFFFNLPDLSQLSSETVGIKRSQLEVAVNLIKEAINKKKKIVIFGDYDADGLCATAILWQALFEAGAEVSPLIPNRFEEGYGLNQKAVQKILSKYPDVGLVITVDNGIVANSAVEVLRRSGIEVIITDHHLPQNTLPPANAILHSTQIAGSGVSWFLAREFNEGGVDLVAIGTIADVLPLLGINRVFVRFGLEEIKKNPRPGLKALFETAGLSHYELTPSQISFAIAPRLNAGGRLKDNLDALRLLCVNSYSLARQLAETIEKLNRERQDLTDEHLKKAKIKLNGDKKNNVLVLADSSFHQGIIGLVAGRLTDEFGVPSVVIAKGKEISKGSARSVPGVHILDLLSQTGVKFEELGGHKLAAGFTIKTEKIPDLATRLQELASSLKIKPLLPELKIEFETDFSLLTPKFYYLISQLEPFGFGNPTPYFLLRKARVVEARTIGNGNKHLRLTLVDSQINSLLERTFVKALGFDLGEWADKLLPGDLIDIVFSLGLEEEEKGLRIVLFVKDLRPSI